MNLFYSKNLSKKEIYLSKEESRHCIKVLRKKKNDIIRVTNGKGSIYITKITSIENEIVQLENLKNEFILNRKTKIHIAIAPPKNRIRFEWFLEKVTEIGVDIITPLLCTNSERKQINLIRSQKILISAMKQSNNSILPQINNPTQFKDFLEGIENNSYIAHCHAMKKVDFKTILAKQKKYKNITVMIGPEGDFTREEIIMSEKRGINAIKLGENRLRTETAGIIVCNMINTIL